MHIFAKLNILIIELTFNLHNFQIYSFGLGDFLCISNLHTEACPLGRVYSR